MSASLRIASMGDRHIGNSAYRRTHPGTGLNLRVRDGYLALRETVTQIIEANPTHVVDTGDIFHYSHPAIADIVWVRSQLQRLSDAGITTIINTGNHDAASQRGRAPATAALHDPDRGIHVVTDPYQKFQLADDVHLHMISHYGLARAERLIPEPIEGEVNILSSHGVASVPGHEVFTCVDSPAEQPIGLDLLTDERYAQVLLGHYHSMGEILPGVWYTGSAFRRGFADAPGGRGWLMHELDPSGTVTTTPHYISQRAQYDLPVIDATGKTGAEITDQINHHLDGIDVDGAIIRQIVVNCPASTRRGIDMTGLKRRTSEALHWDPVIRRPEPVESDSDDIIVASNATSLRTARRVDLPTAFAGWMGERRETTGMSETQAQAVIDDGTRHLREAQEALDAKNRQ